MIKSIQIFFTYMEQASVEERDRTKNKITHYYCKYLAKNINFKKTFLNNKNSQFTTRIPEYSL